MRVAGVVLAAGAVAGQLPEQVPPDPREHWSITIAVLFPLLPWVVGYLLLRRAVDTRTRGWQVFTVFWALCAAGSLVAAAFAALSG